MCMCVCRVSNLADLKLNTEIAESASTVNPSTSEINENMNASRNFERSGYSGRYSDSSFNAGVSTFP